MAIKVGIIGAGAIADDHCSNVNRYNGAEVVAVADLSKTRRDELKKKYSLSQAYEHWEALVADKEIDAVVVALPNALHAPVSLAAIREGKHVLIDKPFAMNFGEAERVAAASAEKNVVVMVGMNMRYGDAAQTLRALVERGELGEIYHTKVYWCRRDRSPKFGTWFVNKAMSGGGCLLDIGVHALDLAMFLSDCWNPVAVSGQVLGKFGHRGLGEGGWGRSDYNADITFDVDDFATAMIKCSDGMTIELTVSWVLHQESRGRSNVELFGTEAGACMNPLKLFRFGKVKGEYEVVEPQNVEVKEERDCRQFDWLDTIAGKRESICTLEQALVVQKVLDAIYKSSETGREIRISST